MSQIQRTRYILFNGSGRINRKEYWMIGVLLRLGLTIGVATTGIAGDRLLNAPTKEILGDNLGGIVAFIGGAIVFLPLIAFHIWTGIAVPMKRWHDLGLTGWMNLLSLIPFIGGLFWIIVGLIPGQKSINKYGPPPGPQNKVKA